MLVLARKLNEKILIGNHIEISVIEIKGDQIKLGIVAPPTVKVYRQEVYLAIEAENRAAAASARGTTDLPRIPGLFKGDS